MMVTNADGMVTLFNEPYGRFLGVDHKIQVGRHTTEVVENTRMHIVAQTGVPEINVSQRIKGQQMVVQRIPIQKNGKVIAVFGQVMFKDVREVGRLARRLSRLEQKVKVYEAELSSLRSTRYTFESIVGSSKAMSSLRKEARQAASNDLPVLITGESGTGKELFAQAIHQAGKRSQEAFMRINCAAIPKDLFESEFFGYDKGAFTGARDQGKPGKFEMAHGGTVFLDEIGELPLEMQPKLLRVLEEKEFERVGGTSLVKTDFRLIAATNQNLEKMLVTGAFRKDLFYRLNVIPIEIPPLRERPEDVIPLAYHLLGRICGTTGRTRYCLTEEAQKALCAYAWPGNARELCNVLERVLAKLEGDKIHLNDLPCEFSGNISHSSLLNNVSLHAALAKAEKKAILRAMKKAGNNKAQAARMLGIHRTLLYKKLKKHNISQEEQAD
ncbi:ATPase AAA [Dethiosulfatarculus sandiegensis]|uniref:ATPase AAA n=1 Tax=Dethiosulfatarculus sandiegensis TaxID=1429043 RepID=A0A0D2GGZ4_9BACT|nr:ATPase AAA [Dethiosulfatarculus sandiegensis]